MAKIYFCENFNSIKVRLKPHRINAKKQRDIFQFHKGTIKTRYPLRYEDILPYFNSIKVRLKLAYIDMPMRAEAYFNSIKVRLKLGLLMLFVFLICYFNSIKVRLKRSRQDDIGTEFSKFQFHKGTIKTPSLSTYWCPSNLFQFHKGTIKTFNNSVFITR